MRSAAFSAIMIVGALVFPRTTPGSPRRQPEVRPKSEALADDQLRVLASIRRPHIRVLNASADDDAEIPAGQEEQVPASHGHGTPV